MVADMKGSNCMVPCTASTSTRYLLLFGVCVTLLTSLPASSQAAATPTVNHVDSPDGRYSSDRATSQFQVDDVFTAGVRRRDDAEADSEQQQAAAVAARARRAAPGGRWAKTNLQVWGKREADIDNARTKDWAKNNFKIWGKRNFDAAAAADDSEQTDETTMMADSERNKWQEAMRLLRSLFLIRGEPSRLPPFGTRSRTVDGDAASMYYNTKRETKEEEDLSGVPDWGKKGWASNNVRIWG